MMRRTRSLIVGAASLLSYSGVILAQSEIERFERGLEQIRRDTLLRVDQNIPIDQRFTLDYGAYLTFSYLSLDDNNNDNHVLRQTEFLGFARMNLDLVHEVFLRYRTGWRDFNDGDSFDGRGDEPIDGDLDVGYYRFDLARAKAAYQGIQTNNNLIIKAGRDLVYWANGLTIAQYIDGVTVDVVWNKLTLSAIAGVTPVRTVDFDASRPNFDSNTRRGFYGGMLSAEAGAHRPFVFGLIQRDYNEDDFSTQGGVPTDFHYDSYYIGVGSTGSVGNRLLYGVEAVYEGGKTLSNSFEIPEGGPITPVNQTEDDIHAWAADVRVDYLIKDRRKSRIGAELILASGDDDRGSTSSTFNGNTPGTDDNAFNGFGLLNTGLAFAPQVSNLLAVRVGGSTFPLPDSGSLRRLQVGTDLFVFAKLDGDAPIDEPSAAGESYLGWEPDLFLNWQMTSDITFAVRYGIFFPNEDAFGNDEIRQYLFMSVSYAF